MARFGLMVSVVGIAAFTVSSLADVSLASTKTKNPVPGEDGCYKKIGIKGRPHKLNTVASLSAVRLWSEAANKHGPKYAMWHNAANSSIKCQKLPRSEYFSCFASGKPCPARDEQARKQN